MALIIEDGSVVANANSFTTDAEFVAYALARNLTLPSTSAERDVLQIKAMDFVISNEDCMQGYRVDIDQELPFPRNGVIIYDFLVPSDKIPSTLKKAQMEAGVIAQTVDLLPSSSVQNVQREKLDTLEVAYFKGGKKSTLNVQSVYTFLSPVLKQTTKLVRT